MNARGEVPPIAEIFADHQIYSACEVGNVREENQDFVGFFHTPKSTLLIVADGMGGHSGGFEASRMAVKEMGVFFNENQDLAPEVLLGQSIVHAHTSILEFAQSNPKFEGMGTTIVALILCDNQVWVAHVGDSRIHLLRDGQFIQLTIDHSCVNTLARMGEIDIPDLDNHPFGHLLERSLGVESNLEVEVRPEPIAVKTGDKFILSSDGFWQSCQDKDAIRILSNNDHSAAVQEALEHALAEGSRDNVTVGMLFVSKADPAPEGALKVVDVRDAFFALIRQAQARKVEQSQDTDEFLFAGSTEEVLPLKTRNTHFAMWFFGICLLIAYGLILLPLF